MDALSGGYVILWATDAVPDSSVQFVLDATTAEKFKLVRNSTGLRISRRVRTRIVVR